MTEVIDAVRRFGENSVIIFRALFRWFSLQSYFVNKIVFPLEQLVVFTLLGIYAGGREVVAFYVIGNSIVLASLGSLAVASSISDERAQATLGLILGTPANRLANLLQRGVVPLLDALFTVTIALVLATVLFDVDFGSANWSALALSVLVGGLSAVALGFLLGVLTLAYLDLYFVWNLFFMLLLIVAGVNIPPDELPGWLQPLHEIVPLGRSISAAREALAGGALGDIADLLAIEVATGAAYLMLGYALLRRLEAIALRRGTLELT